MSNTIKLIVSVISVLLCGFAAGCLAAFLYFTPKIAQFRVEELKMEAFSACLETKIMGQGSYTEIMLADVLNCASFILENNN